MPRTLLAAMAALLLILNTATLTVARADDFTAKQRQQLEALRGDLEQGCRRDLAARIADPAHASAPAASRWLADVANTPEYCGCTAAGFTQGLSPRMLDAATEDEARTLMRRSAVQCMLPRLKTTFPALCRTMVTEPAPEGAAPAAATAGPAPSASTPGPVPGEEAIGRFCGCVQPDIDAVTVDSYDDFIRATTLDYAEYRKSGVLAATTPGSMLASMQRCGLSQLRGQR